LVFISISKHRGKIIIGVNYQAITVDNCNSGGAAVEHRFNLFFAAFLIQTRLIDGFDEIVFCDVGLDLVN
jgi:uncharacterized membrane protein